MTDVAPHEVEITSEMISDGAAVIERSRDVLPSFSLAEAVYRAMCAARPELLSAQSESAPFVAPLNPAAMEQKTVDTVARDAARYRFRHSNYVDKDGYEYGYCKVRWKGGAVESMLWADDAEIDAAMAAAGFK